MTFFLSIPFENNLREWFFQVTNPLYIGVPTSGYSFYFGLSLKLIFGLFLFLLLLKNHKKIPLPSFRNDWPLLIFFILACANTLFYFSPITWVGLIRLWLSILIYFSSKIFFKSESKLFFTIISALFIFSSLIGFNQLIKQKPLGKFIELTPSFSEDEGYSTTDGQVQYRVSGFISHPVYFGSFMSILLPIFIAHGLTTNFFLTLPISLIGVVVMLGTNSRTVWLTLALSFFLLFPHLKKKYQPLLTRNLGKIIFSTFAIISALIIISRIQSITKIFSENGNGSIRLELLWQSLLMVSQHPFGVGLNQFTQSLVTQKLPQSLDGFIVPVHNTFLIIITELGIIAGSFFIYFVIKSIFFKKISTTPPLLTYGAIIGAATFLISSQFHPLFNLDPTFDLFMFTLGFINSQCQPSSKT
ncbi:MAG: O-antigen ligase family protein [Candidatus Shapirobacteria bacterium]